MSRSAHLLGSTLPWNLTSGGATPRRRTFSMDPVSAILGIGLPLLLALATAGVSIGFAMTSSDSVGFLIAKACFAVAALDVVAFAIYWAVATRQQLPLNIVIPALIAAIAVPVLVISLQWLQHVEAQLSTRLYPGNEKSQGLPFDVDVPKDALRVVLGTNLAWTTKMPQAILRMAGETMIEIDREPGPLKHVEETAPSGVGKILARNRRPIEIQSDDASTNRPQRD
jgi:hypothetical protein